MLILQKNTGLDQQASKSSAKLAIRERSSRPMWYTYKYAYYVNMLKVSNKKTQLPKKLRKSDISKNNS